jgi:hypothetical protein
VAVEGRYSLVFVAANTFFGVLTQEGQVLCFENIEAHLVEGRLCDEAFVPDPTRFDPRSRSTPMTANAPGTRGGPPA